MNPVLRQLKLVPVDFGINNGNNGMFTGQCTDIHFNGCLITSGLLDKDGFVGVKIKFTEPNIMKFGRLKIIYLKRYTCGASWCADTIWITKSDLAKILNYLRNLKHWGFDDAYSDIYDKFEKGEQITEQDIDWVYRFNGTEER